MIINTAQKMINLGKKLSLILPKRSGIIYLKGDLGAGKTTLVKGIIQGLGYYGKIKSPSFSLIEFYSTSIPIAHLDLYRINSHEEIIELGIEEYLTNSYGIIEWPEKGENFIPPADLEIKIEVLPNLTRKLHWKFKSNWGMEIKQKIDLYKII